MLIKRGSVGSKVRKIQEKLGVTIDGIFGPITEAKLIEYQTKNGLTADGMVGDSTWNKLFPTQNVPIVNNTPLKIERLQGHIPDNVIAQIPDTATKFNITNNLRLAHFLAQCAHESGNFRYVVEFASGAAYEGRRDLGNVQPGDGVKFKGRGYIQLTGRANYTRFSTFCNEDCVANPDLVATKYPMMSAAYFFNSINLWDICDEGATDAIVTKVTIKVNGGTNGLDDRLAKFRLFNDLLNS